MRARALHYANEGNAAARMYILQASRYISGDEAKMTRCGVAASLLSFFDFSLVGEVDVFYGWWSAVGIMKFAGRVAFVYES